MESKVNWKMRLATPSDEKLSEPEVLHGTVKALAPRPHLEMDYGQTLVLEGVEGSSEEVFKDDDGNILKVGDRITLKKEAMVQ